MGASENELLVSLVASLAALSQRSRELTVRVAGVSKRTRLANVRDATLKSRHEAA